MWVLAQTLCTVSLTLKLPLENILQQYENSSEGQDQMSPQANCFAEVHRHRWTNSLNYKTPLTMSTNVIMLQVDAVQSFKNLSVNFINILHYESCVDAVTPCVTEGNSSVAGGNSSTISTTT